jgi:hypothetical protein
MKYKKLKKVLPSYQKYFDENKDRIEELEQENSQRTFLNIVKSEPDFFIISSIATFGLTALFGWGLLKLERKEFKDQLKLWKLKNT